MDEGRKPDIISICTMLKERKEGRPTWSLTSRTRQKRWEGMLAEAGSGKS